MDHFRTREGSLFVEDFPISKLASLYGSPCYVYSKAILTQNFLNFHNALGSHPHRICYAVKANGALALLQTLNQLGAGFDIVSEGELARVQKATFKTNHIIFSGVGKTKTELQAALLAKIFCFNIESEDELMCLQKLAQDKNQKAPISFRINPNVDAKSHPFLSTGNLESKFGIPIDTAPSLYLKAKSLSHIEIKGIACHIGSQITTLLPFLDALDKLLALKNTLAQHNIHITHLNLGGGLGVPYTKESPPTILDYAQSIFEKVKTYKDLEIIIEPGRAIVANAGILITQVIRTKTHGSKHFCIVDAGMNDLIRPMLYGAQHKIEPVISSNQPQLLYDVVGPVCETSDIFAKNCALRISTGDFLAIHTTGAYGFCMSSNYNSRVRAPEVMVDGNKHFCIRQREAIPDLFASERLLPEEA